MGFGASAGWAQALADVVTAAAQLPPERRVTADEPPPHILPVWGTILDDVWALEDNPDQPGVTWSARAPEEWEQRGVESNRGKAVDRCYGGEIQGVLVDAKSHWVGVSVPRRTQLLQGLIEVLLEWRPRVASVDRLVGKLAFAQSLRPETRCLLQETYRWLRVYRERAQTGVVARRMVGAVQFGRDGSVLSVQSVR